MPHFAKATARKSSKNARKHHTQESQEVSPLPAVDHGNLWRMQLF